MMHEHEESAAGLQKVFLVLNLSWRWFIGLLSQKKKIQEEGKLMVQYNGCNGGCSLWRLITNISLFMNHEDVHVLTVLAKKMLIICLRFAGIYRSSCRTFIICMQLIWRLNLLMSERGRTWSPGLEQSAGVQKVDAAI